MSLTQRAARVGHDRRSAKNMKRIFITLFTLVILSSLYVLSFRSSHLRQVHPQNNQDYRLVIFGISIPHTPTTTKVYSVFYSPLIEHAASKIPQREVYGTIQKIDLSKSVLSISRATEIGMEISIPASMLDSLRSFSEGDSVHITYSMRPDAEQPFCYYYQLTAIAHVQN
jgi:hypothetical protein